MFKIEKASGIRAVTIILKMRIVFTKAIFLIAVLFPCVASSESTTVRVIRNFASAFFVHQNPSDSCISTFVSIDLFDGLVKTRPDRNPVMTAFVSISEFNSCTSESLVDAFGSPTLTASEFLFAEDLSHAVLNATVELFDFVSNSVSDFSIAVEWNSTSDLARRIVRSHVWTPGFVSNFHLNGLNRDAEASGSVSDGSRNFIPGVSESAIIGSEKTGQIQISH